MLIACLFICVLLTPDALTTTASAATAVTDSPAAATALTSQHLMASCDVTRCRDNTPSQQLSLADNKIMYSDTSRSTSVVCPVITLSTESESASVGESFLTAELPLQSDWLPIIQSSSSSVNHNSNLLTLQSLDMNDNSANYAQSFEKRAFDDLDLTDGAATSDDSQTVDSPRGGT